MAITAKETKQRELTPTGNHVARCYKMIHFGHIPENDYNGNLKLQNKVSIYFELPGELRKFNEDEDEQPMSISKEYTVSLHEKANLRLDLESWRGKQFSSDELQGFDLINVLSKPCLINIVHKTAKSSGNQYAAISSITPLIKGMECPDQVNKTFVWDYDENFDVNILEEMHEYFQTKIKSSEEYQQKLSVENPDIQESPMPNADDELIDGDDLPF